MATPKRKYNSGKKEKKDVFQMLGEQIIQNIEEGNTILPTRDRKPGTVYKPANGAYFNPYSSVNAIRADMTANKKGYLDKAIEKYGTDIGPALGNKYVTANYVMKNPEGFGDYAIKGKKADMAVVKPSKPYWYYFDENDKRKFYKQEKDDNGKFIDPPKSEIERLNLRKGIGNSTLEPVFNVMQFESLPDDMVKKAEKEVNKLIKNPVQHAEFQEIRTDMAEALGVKIRETMNIQENTGGFYNPQNNEIHLRPASVHSDEKHQMRIFFHEMTHATGSEDRLDRPTLKDYHKDIKIRAQEEFVAELGAAFLSQHFGIETNDLGHEGYLKSWVSRINESSEFLRESMMEASKAAEYAINKYEIHYEQKYGVDLKAEKEATVIPYNPEAQKEEKKKKPSQPSLSQSM